MNLPILRELKQRFCVACAPSLFGALVIALGASCVLAQQAGELQLAGARQVFDGTMLPGVEVATFSHCDTLFPVNVVPRGGAVKDFEKSPLTLKKIRFRADGEDRGSEDMDLYDYLADNRVAGLLILKDGKVVMEDH